MDFRDGNGLIECETTRAILTLFASGKVFHRIEFAS